MLEAGRLNRSVVIERRAVGQDDAGQPLESWEEVWRGWAGFEALTAGTARKYSNAGFTSQVSHAVTVRWQSGNPFQAGMRVLHDGTVYDVQLVSNPDAGRERLDLLCLQRDGGSA